MFDISASRQETEQEQDEGTPVPVKNRLGEPQFFDGPNGREPVVVIMAGRYSRRYKRKEHEQRQRRIKPSTFTEGKFHDDAQELVVACVIGWRGISDRGTEVACNEHNALQLFKAAPWVYDDCAEAMNNPALFSKSSSPE